ncbi:anti-sigma factor family protein [Mucilaginibacter xinganensis]|uniref:Uncharacterized protein n=1 Tax=Mucilaginibacter xinganensis TaxID=1234841 RepID=A0A223P2Y5_9SPHI|nr:carboxypeptidase-like regulatory domain-containing protein [Mucilaginibacter xinganensis]ASU36483.1 hypothetical protein MuYL_4600 [Mucilaginibacter xinganensis]
MSKKETDILLIRKYLNGELDARAMHQLEKRAQDDPFLMDAMEGYENAGANQQAQLNELTTMLQQRVTQKEKRIIPYRWLAIAASVLIAITIGLFWLQNDGEKKRQTSANIVEPVKKDAVNPVATDTIVNNNLAANRAIPLVTPSQKKLRKPGPAKVIVADKSAADNVIASVAPDVAADTASDEPTPLNEMVVMDYSSQKKKAATQSAAVVDKSKLKPVAAAREQALPSAVAGVSKTPAGSPLSAPSNNPIILQGRIIDKTDGMALPGVSVRIPGTSFGAVTDNNGKFSIPVDSGKSNNIVIAYIGYNTVKINTRHSDSLKTIALQPQGNSLSEVVVTGYGARKNIEESIVSAHPREGWHSFKKYLNGNAASPDSKTGTVKLSFMVDRNGSISDVVVIKGLSTATNKKAIDLINNGPEWVGNTSGQTEQVTVRIKFAVK